MNIFWVRTLRNFKASYWDFTIATNMGDIMLSMLYMLYMLYMLKTGFLLLDNMC